SSEVAAFLKTYGRPDERNMLIVHSSLQYALLPTIRAFGPEHMVASLSDLEARSSGKPPPPNAASSWKQKLRDLVLPEERFYPIDASKVEVLAIVDDDDRPDPASDWSDPVLDGIKARLSRHHVFDRAPFHVHFFEAP